MNCLKKEISKDMYFKLRRDYELLKILYEKQVNKTIYYFFINSNFMLIKLVA